MESACLCTGAAAGKSHEYLRFFTTTRVFLPKVSISRDGSEGMRSRNHQISSHRHRKFPALAARCCVLANTSLSFRYWMFQTSIRTRAEAD